jgi:L-fuculose-phosphate aldolase
VLPELALLFGEAIPLVAYATPGTAAVGELLAPFIGQHAGALLANHGAVTWGPDLAAARVRMESLEHAARILLAARTIGRVTHLDPEQFQALVRPRGKTRT